MACCRLSSVTMVTELLSDWFIDGSGGSEAELGPDDEGQGDGCQVTDGRHRALVQEQQGDAHSRPRQNHRPQRGDGPQS